MHISPTWPWPSPQQANNKKCQGTPELTGKRLTSQVHHRRRTAPSGQPDRTDEGINGWTEWDRRWGPTTTKRLRASEKELLSLSLSPTPPLKKSTSSESPYKKIPKLNFLCVRVHMCIFECVPVFCVCVFFFSFLAWCQMFQLSTAVQHHW